MRKDSFLGCQQKKLKKLPLFAKFIKTVCMIKMPLGDTVFMYATHQQLWTVKFLSRQMSFPDHQVVLPVSLLKY